MSHWSGPTRWRLALISAALIVTGCIVGYLTSGRLPNWSIVAVVVVAIAVTPLVVRFISFADNTFMAIADVLRGAVDHHDASPNDF